MNQAELIELSRAYVSLSNSHQVDIILLLLDPYISYKSNYTGTYIGKEEVRGMMIKFFNQYNSVYWNTFDYKPLSGNSVEFKFNMSAIQSDSNILITRSGSELLRYSDTGLITHLDITQL